MCDVIVYMDAGLLNRWPWIPVSDAISVVATADNTRGGNVESRKLYCNDMFSCSPHLSLVKALPDVVGW